MGCTVSQYPQGDSGGLTAARDEGEGDPRDRQPQRREQYL